MSLNSATPDNLSSVNDPGTPSPGAEEETSPTPADTPAEDDAPQVEETAAVEESAAETPQTPNGESAPAAADEAAAAEPAEEEAPSEAATAQPDTAQPEEMPPSTEEIPPVEAAAPEGEAAAEEAALPEAGPAAEEAGSAGGEAPAVEEAGVEAAVPEADSVAVEETTPAVEEIAAAEEAAVEESGLRRGDIVEAVVVQTTPTEVLLELADGKTGIISGRELSRMDRQALEDLQVGRTVLVYVLNPSNRSGQVVLSLTRAQEENDWQLAQQYAESQELYSGKVSGYNKGGLIVRFGRVRGFVPASQVSDERRQKAVGNSPLERWGGMIGDDIVVKVVEVNRSRNRLILSERAAMAEWRNQRKARLLEKLEIGEVRTGTVVSLTDFGAFVDLGGADGLVHLTELSWKHVTHPREVVKIGQQVQVKVISLDRERRRIGLSMKALEADPWEQAVDRFRVGQLVRGTVTKLTKFGAFARLADAPEIEGLIHISELSEHRVGHPREVVNEGDDLTLRIVKIDRANRRMGLSLKQVDAEEYLEIDLATYGTSGATAPLIEDIQQPEKVEEAAAAEAEPVEPEAAADESVPAAEETEPEIEAAPQAEGEQDTGTVADADVEPDAENAQE